MKSAFRFRSISDIAKVQLLKPKKPNSRPDGQLRFSSLSVADSNLARSRSTDVSDLTFLSFLFIWDIFESQPGNEKRVKKLRNKTKPKQEYKRKSFCMS